MVWVTRLDGSRFLLNSDLIEHAEATPDTVVFLTNGHHFVVRESLMELQRQIVHFRHQIYAGIEGQE